MKRIDQLLIAQLNKPRKYCQLKDDPFPYLQQSNRFEIFQFILQLQSEHKKLTQQVSLIYPHKTLEQCLEQQEGVRAKRRLIEINKGSIQKMDIEIKEKMGQCEQLRQQNQRLQGVKAELTVQLETVEGQLIEVEKEKRTLEMKLKIQQERQSKNVDLSLIFNNLYKEVKETLNTSF